MKPRCRGEWQSGALSNEIEARDPFAASQRGYRERWSGTRAARRQGPTHRLTSEVTGSQLMTPHAVTPPSSTPSPARRREARNVNPRSERTRLYLGSLEHRPLLTREGELDLARRIDDGERAAIDAILASPIALRELGVVARELASRRLRLRDVRGAARDDESDDEQALGRFVALLERAAELSTAIESGATVAPAASAELRAALGQARLHRHILDRLVEVLGAPTPVHLDESRKKVRQVRSSFEREHGREPSETELHERSGLSPERLRTIAQLAPEPLSLQTPSGADRDAELGDFTPDRSTPAPDEAIAEARMREATRALLEGLTPREQDILRKRFGLDDTRPHTLAEIGESMSLSRERIRQIEAEALRKLRTASEEHELETYLEH